MTSHAKLSCFDTTELVKMLENVKDEKDAILPKKSKKKKAIILLKGWRLL